jgi:hypothetical protein
MVQAGETTQLELDVLLNNGVIHLRTEDQIKQKLIQLQQMQQQFYSAQFKHQIEILEWVLNNPTESYHQKEE